MENIFEDINSEKEVNKISNKEQSTNENEINSIIKNDKEDNIISRPINENEKSLISVIIKNVKGSLTKVTEYCARNNMNIERLVLSNFKLNNLEHRVILYITGDRQRINSLIDGLKQIDVVVSASNFQTNSYIERELILVKVKEDNPQLSRIMDLVNEYNGSTILYKNNIIIFQFINEEEKNIELMERLENLTNDIEVLKSGLVATSLDDNMII